MIMQPIFRLTLLANVLCLLGAGSTTHADVVKWRQNLDAAKIEAAQTGKLVLLHFWTPSCGPCKKLDADVFSQPQIGELLERDFVPVKVNADLSPALAGSLNIDRVPSEVVLSPQGNVVTKLECPPTPDGYGSQLVNLAQHYRQHVASNNSSAQPPVRSAYAGLQVGQYNNAPVATSSNSNQAAHQNGPPVSAPASSPQVTHNIYATATPNPQASGQPVTTAPGRYGDQVAATPQQSAPPTTQAQQNAVQTTPQPPQGATQQFAANSTPTSTTTNTTSDGAQVAGPPELPAGAPPLAFEGYCPVTLKQVRKWVMGDPKFGAIHRGRTYLFTGEAQRNQFLTNPDAFSPVFSGIDPVKMLDENQSVEGSRRFGYEYRGAFYLFSSQETMARFASQPDRYAAGVRQAMMRMDATGSETIRR